MLDTVSLLVRGVKEVGLRPTWEAVAYQMRLLWYRLRFGGRTRPLPTLPAAYDRPGPVTRWDLDGQTLTVECANGVYALTVLTPEMIRVRFRPFSRSERASRASYAVARAEETWPACGVEVAEREAAVELTTSRLRCRTERASGRLTFLDLEGRVISEDADGVGWHRDGQVICHKRIQPDEHFYGLGERTSGLDHQGGAFETWNSDPQTYEVGQDPVYLCIPFLLGLHSGGEQGYGILFDNTYRGRFDLGSYDPEVASFGARRGSLRYTFIYGPALTDVVACYTELTGRQAFPPLWALGYQQSRWSYYPEARVRRLAADFRETYGVPCDAIHLDIGAMDGHRCFTWDRERFPDPAGMIADLHDQGFKVVVIVDAGIKIDPDYAVYQSGLEADVFCTLPNGQRVVGPVWPGNCVFPDFTAPRVRAWWRDLCRTLTEVGIDGIWNDMNEPAIFGPEGTTMPEVAAHDLEGLVGDHAEGHNVYGMEMARATAEAVARLRPNERPFVITRAGWAGVQRYAASWTADNRATWEHLWLTIPMVANLGLSGLAFSGPDTGGFFGHPSAELFTRWLQMSAFLPFFRAHTYLEDPDQEPWSWGEPTLSINRDWIERRYRLLPYLYTAVWQCARTGVPMVRPLVLAFQDDPSTHDLDDQFLCGDDLLVAPVLEEGATSRSVYVPNGTWYDVWSDERMTGPTRVAVKAPLERIPVFVRAGAVVPTGPTMRYVGERRCDPLTLHVYPPDGSEEQMSLLYEDDGRTYAFREGEYLLTRFWLRVVRDSGMRLELRRETEGRYRVAYGSVEVVVHGVTRLPRSVTVDGRAVEVGEMDEGGRALRLRVEVFEELRIEWR